MTRQAKERLLRIYAQMPAPKFVIALGSCAICGAPFNDSYSHFEGVNNILNVDVYIGGCPPTPEGIIKGLLTLTKNERAA